MLGSIAVDEGRPCPTLRRDQRTVFPYPPCTARCCIFQRFKFRKFGKFRLLELFYTRTSGPRYPPQFDRKKIFQGGVSLLGGSQIKNPEEEEPPFKLLKSINFGGCSLGGWFFLRVLGLETTQQIHSPGGGGFLRSNWGGYRGPEVLV